MADDRASIIERTRGLLRSIKSLDDFTAHRAEVLDMMEAGFKSAVDMLRRFLDSMLSLTPEEQQKHMNQFQDDNYLMDPEVGQEMDRIAALPGAAACVDAFQVELQQRIGPYLEEFTSQMGRLMEHFMGGLMGGIANALGGGMAEGDAAAKAEPPSDGPEPRPRQTGAKARGRKKQRGKTDRRSGK